MREHFQGVNLYVFCVYARIIKVTWQSPSSTLTAKEDRRWFLRSGVEPATWGLARYWRKPTLWGPDGGHGCGGCLHLWRTHGGVCRNTQWTTEEGKVTTVLIYDAFHTAAKLRNNCSISLTKRNKKKPREGNGREMAEEPVKTAAEHVWLYSTFEMFIFWRAHCYILDQQKLHFFNSDCATQHGFVFITKSYFCLFVCCSFGCNKFNSTNVQHSRFHIT